LASKEADSVNSNTAGAEPTMLCVIRLALRPGMLGRLVSAVLLVLTLAACGDDEGPVYIEQPVEQLYNRALNELYLKNYEESARLFDEVERQHPYSAWASKAQLMAAFVQYQDSKYDDAINTLDRFRPQGHRLRLLSARHQLLRADLGRRARPEDDPARAGEPG
jgi:hypothetical protein